MAKSIKLGSDTFLDATGVMVNSATSNRKTLESFVGEFGTRTISGTTTSSGAIGIPSDLHSAYIMDAHLVEAIGLVYRRDTYYLTVLASSLSPLVNTSVTIDIAYWKPST